MDVRVDGVSAIRPQSTNGLIMAHGKAILGLSQDVAEQARTTILPFVSAYPPD